MEGLAALLNGDEDLFELKMKAAVALEEQTNFPTGPPSITKPSYELYGEWLIQQGRYEEAIEQFDKGLARMPRKSKLFRGKYAALTALNRLDKSQEVEKELLAIYAQADEEVKIF